MLPRGRKISRAVLRFQIPPALKRTLRHRLCAEDAGIEQVDYAAVVRADNLQVWPQVSSDSIALVAAHVGHTRLIDNRLLVEQ